MEMYPKRESVHKHNSNKYPQCQLDASFINLPSEIRESCHHQIANDHSSNGRKHGNRIRYNNGEQCLDRKCGRSVSDSQRVTYNNKNGVNKHRKDYKRAFSDSMARNDKRIDPGYYSNDTLYDPGIDISKKTERCMALKNDADVTRHKPAHTSTAFTRSFSDPPVEPNMRLSDTTTAPSKIPGRHKEDTSKRTKRHTSSNSNSKGRTRKMNSDGSSGSSGRHSNSVSSSDKSTGLNKLTVECNQALADGIHKTRNSSSKTSTKHITSNVNQMYIDLELNKKVDKYLSNSQNGMGFPHHYQDGGASCVSCRSARKRLLVVTAVLLITLLLAGISAVITTILSEKTGDVLTTDALPGYRMLRAHVEMRLVNELYTPSMGDNDSMAFKDVSAKLCREIDYAFLTSSVNEEYFGCSLVTLRPGSINVYYTSPFLDTNDTSNRTLLKHIIINATSFNDALPGLDGDLTAFGGTTVNGVPHGFGGLTAPGATSVNSNSQGGNLAKLGEYLVNIGSINITIDKYTAASLPERPTLPQTAQPSPIYIGASIVNTSVTAETAAATSDRGSSAASNTIRAPTTDQPDSTGGLGIQKATTTDGGIGKNPLRHVTLTHPRPAPVTTEQPIHSVMQSQATSTKTATLSTTTATSSVTPSPVTTSVFSHSPLMATETTTEPAITSSYAEYTDLSNMTWWGEESTTASNNETSTAENMPVVTLMGDTVSLMKEKASVVCIVARIYSPRQVTLSHIDPYGVNHTINTLYKTDFNEAHGVFKTDIIGHKCLFINIEKTWILIGMNFTYVKCDDTGQYMCSVSMDTGQESAVGYLHGNAPSSTPHLSLPIEIIEDKEITEPITCSADVGFPQGQLQWEIKPKGFGHFIPFSGDDIVSRAGTCDTKMTRSLAYTPTRDGNGTLLKCSVVSNNAPRSSSRSSSTVKEIRILPAAICNGVPMNKSIRHPFTCTRYIRCHGDTYDVKECSDQMCFDEESGRCGQSSLAMKTVNAYLNEGVTSLQCRLMHLGKWHNISISKNLPSGETELILMATYGKGDVTMYESSMTGRVIGQIDVSRRYEVDMNMWVYVLTCDDAGEYICHAETPSLNVDVTASIDLKVKPDAPILHVPNEVIEGLPMRQHIACTANVGYPHGHLLLKMRLANETVFHPVPYNVTTIAEAGNCSKSVLASFTFLPTLGHEGMEVQCEIQNNYTLPSGHRLATKEIVHVVSGNFCLANPDKSPQVHPYDCHQYVQCSGGTTYVQQCGSPLCFNPNTLQCDTEPEAQYPFDPKQPCRPNKNGVFYPHPILCNKYIWCVQGQAVIQHCPMGTLYIDSGQCTFEPQRSRCYTNS